MPEALSQDWFRYVWGPLLAGGLVWLASTWKTTADSRTARDARLDTRQEKELSRLDAENEDLRRDLARAEDTARAAEQFAHDQRHGYLDVVSAMIALRRLVRGMLDGVVDRDALRWALEQQEDPAPPPRVPSLRDMAPKRAD